MLSTWFINAPIRRLVLVDSPAQVEEMIQLAYQYKLVSFDTESGKPEEGQPIRIDLLQFSFPEGQCFLVKQKYVQDNEEFFQMMADEAVLKFGADVTGPDAQRFNEQFQRQIKGLVDLDTVIQHLEDERQKETEEPKKVVKKQKPGLASLAKTVLNHEMAKGAARSNWANEELTRGQILYAATDVLIGMAIILKSALSDHPDWKDMGQFQDLLKAVYELCNGLKDPVKKPKVAKEKKKNKKKEPQTQEEKEKEAEKLRKQNEYKALAKAKKQKEQEEASKKQNEA